MENNILFLYQNIITLAPIILGSLVFVLFVTDVYKHEKLLISYLITIGVCVGLIGYGFLELAIGVIVVESIFLTAYAVFRVR